MAAGDSARRDVYQTLGRYLGYAVAHLADVYDFRHVLVLGRVTSGPGGALILAAARDVLRADFPELAARVRTSRCRREGQAPRPGDRRSEPPDAR